MSEFYGLMCLLTVCATSVLLGALVVINNYIMQN